MPVPAHASRPVFDAENPMYSGPTTSAQSRPSGPFSSRRPATTMRTRPSAGAGGNGSRQSSFVRRLLELDSPSSRVVAFSISSSQSQSQSLPPSQPTVDPALLSTLGTIQTVNTLSCSPSPLTKKTVTASPKKTRRASNLRMSTLPAPPVLVPVLAPAPAPVSQPPLLSPPPEAARRKRKSSDLPSVGLEDVSSKRARSSFALPSSSFFLSSTGPQPVFSTAGQESVVHQPAYYLGDAEQLQYVYEPEGACTVPEHVEYAQLIVEIQEELCGYDPGMECDEDIAMLVDALHELLPCLRIKEQLRPLSTLSHQDIADCFGAKGYFNKTTLAMFRAANVTSLSLRSSLCGDEVMVHRNVEETLHVFTLPNSFFNLLEINLNDTPLTNDSLISLQSLRGSLQDLWIKRTGTTDAGLPHLVSLRKLKCLYLTGDSGITDEGVTNLLYMTQLTKLELDNTGITMSGLRPFAAGILTQNRKIELEIPEECEHYMNTLHTQYLVHPSAPLITDPHACGFLSANAVKKNLVEHAKYDASIQVKGAKGELILALRELLERRRADMQVRAVLWKMDEDQETPQSDTALQNAEEEEERKTEYTYSS